jgi:hypothetical protein
MQIAQQAWDKTRGDNPKWEAVDAEFRLKLQNVAGIALANGPQAGIAGLEDYEAEVRRLAERQNKKSHQMAAPVSPVDAGRIRGSNQPSLREGATSEQLGQSEAAEPTPKGTGAQEPEPQTPEKAAKDAAGAQSRVEADEVHSPSYPSAARPLAAEAPGTSPQTGAKKSGGSSKKGGGPKKAASKSASGSKGAASKSSAKKAGAAKKASK